MTLPVVLYFAMALVLTEPFTVWDRWYRDHAEVLRNNAYTWWENRGRVRFNAALEDRRLIEEDILDISARGTWKTDQYVETSFGMSGSRMCEVNFYRKHILRYVKNPTPKGYTVNTWANMIREHYNQLPMVAKKQWMPNHIRARTSLNYQLIAQKWHVTIESPHDPELFPVVVPDEDLPLTVRHPTHRYDLVNEMKNFEIILNRGNNHDDDDDRPNGHGPRINLRIMMDQPDASAALSRLSPSSTSLLQRSTYGPQKKMRMSYWIRTATSL